MWNRVKFFRSHGKRLYVHNPISKWVFSSEQSHPTIVAKEIFEPVAVRFLRRRKERGRPLGAGDKSDDIGNRGRYLLSGLLICATCKAHYVAAKNLHRAKRTQVYYVCNTKWRRGKGACSSPNINMAVAEGATLNALLNNILTEGEIKRFIDAFNLYMVESADNSTHQINSAASERDRLEIEIDRMKRAILNGIDPRSFAQELNQHQERLERLESEVQALHALGSREQIAYEPGKLAAWIENIKNNFMTSDFETRRELVRQFIRSLGVHPDKSVEMTWDPESILRLADGSRIPCSSYVATTNTCGGRI